VMVALVLGAQGCCQATPVKVGHVRRSSVGLQRCVTRREANPYPARARLLTLGSILAQKPYEGCTLSPRAVRTGLAPWCRAGVACQARADRDSMVHAVRGATPLIRQARKRRLGEIPAKARAGVPWKGKTQGSIQRAQR
jgi:hypothetical protein